MEQRPFQKTLVDGSKSKHWKRFTTDGEEREVADNWQKVHFSAVQRPQSDYEVSALLLHDRGEVLQDVEMEGWSEDLASPVPFATCDQRYI